VEFDAAVDPDSETVELDSEVVELAPGLVDVDAEVGWNVSVPAGLVPAADVVTVDPVSVDSVLCGCVVAPEPDDVDWTEVVLGSGVAVDPAAVPDGVKRVP
jgi:hypothetical protein